MALINFGPGPSDDGDYNKLLLQEFQKRTGQRDKRDRKSEGKGMMQGGSNAEGALNIINSALEGVLRAEEHNAMLRAAQGQQQAAVDAARSNIGGSASAGTSGASGGSSGGSGGSSGGSGGGSRSSGRQAVADAYYSPDKPAPTMAAGDLSRTMTLPPEVAGDPITPGPTAFGDPAALGGPGMANPEMAVIPKALPPEIAGEASGREGVVGAMLPNLEAAPGPRISTAGWTPEDKDLAIRTAYGEASNQGAVGQQAVAAVIANRVKQSGKSPREVMLAKDQFEPWNRADHRSRMVNLSKDSPEYRQIEANLTPLFEGRIPDPTNGADHFYAPRAQKAEGRPPPDWDNGKGVPIGDHTFFRLGYGNRKGNNPSGRERVRTAALDAAPNTASDADPVAPVAGDNPAVLRRDAAAYDKTNPEAARQLRVRADVAEAIARGEKPPVPLVKPGSRSVATPVEAAPTPATPVEVAQAPMAPLPPRGTPGDLRDLTIDDIAPGFSARRDKIAAGLNSTNPYVRNQALGEYNAMQKELPELQKKLAEINATNRRTVYDQGNQNFRHGQTLDQQRVEEGGRNTRHNQTETRLGQEHEDKFGLDTRKQEFDERKGVVVDGQLVNPATGEVIRGRDQARPLVTPEDRAKYGIQSDDKRPYTVGPDGKLQVTPGDPKTTINNVSNPIAKGYGEMFIDSLKTAKGARDTIMNIHEARNQLDSGQVITGFGAERRLDFNRAGALFGITDPNAIAKTETFRAAIGNSVLDRAKALGANPTDTDRKYINDVMAGNIELNEKSIRQILDIQERTMRNKIDSFNDEAKRLGDTDELRGIKDSITVPAAPSYEDFRKSLPKEAPAPAYTREQIEAEIARRRGGKM